MSEQNEKAIGPGNPVKSSGGLDDGDDSAFATWQPLFSPAPSPKKPILVISGPSGVGKSTQIKLLLKENTNRAFLVSTTTRWPRPEEEQDREYHFLALDQLPEGVTRKNATIDQMNAAIDAAKIEFQKIAAEGKLLFEHTEFYGNLYGTPCAQLEEGLAAGKQMIADVNLDGLEDFRAHYGKAGVQSFFLSADDKQLRSRLVGRDITPHEKNLTPEQRATIMASIDDRMAKAEKVLEEAHGEIDGHAAYDHIIATGLTPEATAVLVRNALAGTPANQIAGGSGSATRLEAPVGRSFVA